MRCLVVGGRGMLGTELVAHLRGAGEEAVVWDLPQNDITDVNGTINGVHEVGPDVIFHLAAWTDVDGCEADPARAAAVNFQGAWAVALGAAETGARMLFVSTDYVFDGKRDRPWREKDQPNPLSVYGRSKLMGEKAVQRTGKRWFIVRTSWLYGRHGRNFVETIRNKAREVAELKVVTDQVGSPTWVRDLCEPLLTIGRSDRFGTYHLTNSGRCSWFEFAQEIVRLTGADCRVEPTDSATFKRPAPRPAFSVLDNGQVKRKFGIRLRDWREALQVYLEDVSPAQAGG